MHEYDLQKMNTLLYDFFNLTGIKICIYDADEQELCYYPEKRSEFCRLLREDRLLDQACRECDRRAFEVCKKTHKQYVYTCHAGLIECVSPVLYDNTIIGYIVIGQIKANEKNEYTLSNASESLSSCFHKLPSLAQDKINSAIHILDACTGYEYLKSLIKNNNDTTKMRIVSYIENNLFGDLSVSALCRAFRISKSELYSIFRDSFHSSVANYIKYRRLSKACDLLERTELPVHKIGEMCGIPDYNYFSKQFKKQHGMSPTHYRKTARTI